MGQNIQSVKRRKASRMHHDPNINEIELLCNNPMLQKYIISVKLVHKYPFV